MIYRISFLATCWALLLISACKTDPVVQSKIDYERFNNYITGYTQSPVSRCGHLSIDLGFVVESEELPAGLFEITPTMGGEVVLNANKTRITLQNPQIKHNVVYTVRFNIGLLTEMPAGLETFTFPLRAEQQALDIAMDAPVNQSMEVVSYSGKVNFSVCEPERWLVEQGLTAEQNGVTLPIRWLHKKNKGYSQFTISDIKRSPSPGTVDLSLSMAPYQVDDQSTMQLAVPSQSDFSLLGVGNIQGNRMVEVSFTDPLHKEQRLDGLVTVDGRSISRFKVISNKIQVYFKGENYGYFKLSVLPGIRNIAGHPSKDSYTEDLFFRPSLPSVTIAERGNILPPANQWELPIKITSATGFRLRILKIYDNNVHRLYQENQDAYAGQRGLENLGKIVLDTVYNFDLDKPYVENYHAIELDRLVNREQGALYKVLLSIPRAQNAYPCASVDGNISPGTFDRIDFDRPWISMRHSFDYYDESYYYGNQQVGNTYYQEGSNEGGNPCNTWFDTKIHDARLLMCTDIGVVAKYEPAEQRFFIYASQITSALPVAGARVRLLDYQGQEILDASTDTEGMALMRVGDQHPYMLEIKYEKDVTYMQLQDAKALSLSTFQVEGRQWQATKKVLFYGDRDVWRPGDTVYLTAMVFSPKERVPANLPVELKLYDPTNKLANTWTVKGNHNGLYNCRFSTDMNALTGKWRLEMSLGGTTYRSTIRVETIRPNRLKMQMAFEDDRILHHNEPLTAPITVKWMHGMPAKGLRTEVTMYQKSLQNPFGAGYSGYIFDDVGRDYQRELGVVADASTDTDGVMDFAIPIQQSQQFPSMMLFNFELRSFEKGGAFSTDLKAIKYSPYSYYVGAKFPGGNTGSQIFISEGEAIMIASVSETGSREKRQVKVTLDHIDHNWWYQFGSKGDYAALSSSTQQREQSYTVTVGPEGKAITIDRFGRYLLTIKDINSGHQVSRMVYSYGDNYSADNKEEVNQLEVLPFHLKKTEYEVGDVLSFELPPMTNGRYLITVEAGGSILHRELRATSSSPTKMSLSVQPQMAPTAYIHVHLMQAWDTHRNDRPLRLFAVQPVRVLDRSTKLEPVIAMQEEVETDEEFTIRVSENQGKAMSYTLAVVDQGLLDITQFRTPDPWSVFFGKEGLQVKTWDIYRSIFHRFLGEYTSLLAVGGDGANAINPTAKARRFKPVVKFLGPFTIDAGEQGSHMIQINDYVGSVRAMVVATDGRAVGHSDKIVAVKKPLMLYTTLPRVLGPDEQIKVPVTVFCMDKSITNVQARITTDELVEVIGEREKVIRFEGEGEQDISFDIATVASVGITSIKLEVESGSHRFVETIDLDLRPSAPLLSTTSYDVIDAAATKTIRYQSQGIQGTRSGTVSVSRGINFSFAPQVEWLSAYPHGCLEQTISRIFPQLYLYQMNLLDDVDEMKYRQQLSAAIQKLRFSQLPSGGFSYWPGSDKPHSWGTSYALHFLLEAKSLGYKVPQDMIDKCIDYQYGKASSPSIHSQNSGGAARDYRTIGLAYRLYVLAQAGKPNYAAMNRLRLIPQLHNTAKWLLAHAFAIIGEEGLAQTVVKAAKQSTVDYKELAGTFGSGLRDQAIIARVLLATGQKIEAKKLLNDISTLINDTNRYMTTQERAQVLMTMAQFAGDLGTMEDSVAFDIALSDVRSDVSDVVADRPIYYDLAEKELDGTVEVANHGAAELYTSITTTGQPLRDESSATKEGLELQVVYYDVEGAEVKPSSMTKGEDYKMTCSVVHPGIRGDYQNLALTAIFPSGWEIVNERMRTQSTFNQGDAVDYRNVRDDRVSLYFDLAKGKRKTFHIMINAAYEGKYWAPPVLCEAMYDATVTAKTEGYWTTIQ